MNLISSEFFNFLYFLHFHFVFKSVKDKGVCRTAPATPGLLRDIASLRINLSLKTVQFSRPIFGHFCEKIIISFSPKYLGLPDLTKYFVENSLFVS